MWLRGISFGSLAREGTYAIGPSILNAGGELQVAEERKRVHQAQRNA
jgi:hypothetical protein